MNSTQLSTIRAAMLASANAALVAAAEAGRDNEAAAILNEQTDFQVWKPQTPAAEIIGAVQWDALTVSDVPDGTAVYTNRVLSCQGRQMNLQILLQGRENINSASPSIQAALHDALTGVPAGPAGNLIGAGWQAVKAVMTRRATLAESLLAEGAGTANLPGRLTWEGTLTASDVARALRGTTDV